MGKIKTTTADCEGETSAISPKLPTATAGYRTIGTKLRRGRHRRHTGRRRRLVDKYVSPPSLLGIMASVILPLVAFIAMVAPLTTTTPQLLVEATSLTSVQQYDKAPRSNKHLRRRTSRQLDEWGEDDDDDATVGEDDDTESDIIEEIEEVEEQLSELEGKSDDVVDVLVEGTVEEQEEALEEKEGELIKEFEEEALLGELEADDDMFGVDVGDLEEEITELQEEIEGEREK